MAESNAKAEPKQDASKQAAAKPSEPPRAFCQEKTRVMDFTAPADGAAEGRFYRIGAMVAYAAVSAPAKQPFQAVIAGLFNDAPGIASGGFKQGEPVPFDGETFIPAGDHLPIGFVAADGKGLYLTGQPG